MSSPWKYSISNNRHADVYINGKFSGMALVFGPTSVPRQADFDKMESSFKGHRVNALVLTGDEGRDKLR